ncbi:MAG: MBL fold metallo-hydrolase [Methanobacteriota archaeon]|nr:MAG: MBL fold metallo-hydrolase [Euryarchaeota archaeon]
MIVRQIPRVETGCMSYLIGDPGSGVAALVDPTEDPRVFLQEASALGLRIERVIETHTHQDHVSGAKALAARLRAPVHLPFKSPAKYPHESIAENSRLRIGDSELRAIHTPGHTPDHMTYVLGDAALVGDCLLVGTVGRADFYPEGPEELYHSVFDKILRLSDEVVVYPAHYGPHHGLPEDRFTTLGHERRFNEALTVKSKEDFIRYMMEGWPPKPGGWREISERNTSA